MNDQKEIDRLNKLLTNKESWLYLRIVQGIFKIMREEKNELVCSK